MKHGKENGLSGILKGAEIPLGAMTVTVTVLPVEPARRAWVALQPWLMGIFAAGEMNKQGEGAEVGIVGMVGQLGNLTVASLDTLCEVFAKVSSYRELDSNGSERVRFFHEKGVMDAVFTGEFDLMLEWIEACVYLNFSKQIEKHVGALTARNARPLVEPTTAEG